MAQDGSGELGEEALDQIEPGGMLGGEDKLEAAGRSGGEPGFGFSRGGRRMIFEDQLDRRVGRVNGIEELEELDELSASVAISNQGVDLSGEQINAGQQAEGTEAFVFVITGEGRMHSGYGRQVWCRRCNRLDTRLFVARY